MKKNFLLLLFILSFVSCNEKEEHIPKSDLEIKMNSIAEGYVKLVLEISKYDPLYVDAYYGPKKWMLAEKNLPFDSTVYKELNFRTDSLFNELDLLGQYKATELETLRYRYLYKQLLAVKAKIAVLNGTVFPFDLESKEFYDATDTVQNVEEFDKVLNELDKILPGKGNLENRVVNFKKQFQIPEEKIEVVFNAAIKECRERTLKYIKLPATEKFKVEYVEKKPWGAYNWYKGNFFSVIQIAKDFPVYIDNPVGLASHEGYPGHHVYNILLEKNLVKDRGWLEYTVYPLYSPQSLIAEGTANYGVNLLFPGNERTKFEKEILFPFAGLDTTGAELYYKIDSLQKKLSGVEVFAARKYLDGIWTKEETVKWLQKYQLRSKERTEKFLSFIETYRSYVITYDVGEKMISNYLERIDNTENNIAKKWEIFTRLISTPQTPSELQD